ncbi:MAG: PIN domain-containing protein [Deltaproteobacteria bacterium]|nr:PIN domain-containing protein [Deltaproteobacteria bacterium]
MIGLDTNILIDLLVRSQPDHKHTAAWINQCRDRLATTPVNIGEVLQLLTHPRVFAAPLSLVQAVDLFQHFVQAFDLALLEESVTWWQELPDLVRHIPGLRGNEVFDARIALCLRHNGIKEIWTKDADFAKYPFLKSLAIPR